jgi:endonuclease/exonuclease/phosphatase family metal-dependent hydrolase
MLLHASPDTQPLSHWSVLTCHLYCSLSTLTITAGCFIKKPASPTLQFGDTEDGCCILYKASKLELLNSHSFTYAYQEAGAAEGCRKIQNQVALLCHFRLKHNGSTSSNVCSSDSSSDSDAPERHIIVATTHLKAEKSLEGETARAAQALQLLSAVTKFRAAASSDLQHQLQQQRPADIDTAFTATAAIPVVIAGDFNALPHCSKDGYAALCYEHLSSSALQLRSAYPVAGDDAYTTWKFRYLKFLLLYHCLAESK